MFKSSKTLFFETEIFCSIINALTVTFDQFNASLLNKSFAQKFALSQFQEILKEIPLTVCFTVISTHLRCFLLEVK